MKPMMKSMMKPTAGGSGIRLRSAMTVALLATCLVSSEALAQEAAAPGSVQDGGLALQEIVVTAQKRSENLQDVPISVAAFSAEQVRELGLSRPLDVGYQVPGLVAKSPNGDSSPLFTIRAVGVTDFTVGNNSPTSIYVDQVVKPYYPMVNFSLFDIERVEVLKGPQGTLYGRNNTGGAVKFVTRQPTDRPDGYVRVDYSRFNTYEVEAAVGGPVSDTLAVRAAGFTRQRSRGWQYNIVSGEDNGKIDRVAGRIAARWTPSDLFSATLTAYAGHNHSDVPQFKLAPPFKASNRSQVCAAALRGERARDGSCVDTLGHFDADPDNRHIQSANTLGKGLSEDGQGGVLTLNWELGIGTLASVSGYDQQGRTEYQDFDATTAILADNSFQQKIHAFSQELRFSSKDDSSVKWMTGLFYSDDKVDNRQVLRSDALFNSSTPLLTPIDWEMTTESYAGFAHVEFPLSPRFSAITGARYTHEERTFVGGTLPLHTRFPTVFVDNRTSANDVSGKVGLNFRVADDMLLYVSASKGFKSGGFNGGFATRAVAYNPYEPERLFAYELGIKSQPTSSLRLNAAAYYYDWREFQATVTRVDPLTNLPTQVLSNAGTARIAGLETEANWRAAPGLDLALSGNWSDPRIIQGIYEGRRLGNSPRFSLAGMVRYERPVAALNGSLYALTDFNYRSRYPLRLVTPTTRPLVYQDAFWLANARVGYKADHDRVEIAAFVKNVFDQEYLLEVFDQGTLNTLDLYAEPRTYGVSLTYRFF